MRRLLAIALLVAACAAPTAVTTPSPPPTPIPSVAPAAAATPAPPARSGTGIITFGKKLNTSTLDVTDEATQFKRTAARIAYSASFLEPVGGTAVFWVVARRLKGGSERLLIREKLAVADPGWTVMANRIDLAGAVDNKAGTYVMRYIRGDTVLAQGTFKLVK